MYNPNYYNWAPEGWRCPVCGRVYSPTTPMCFYCSNQEGTVQTTGTSINDDEWWREYLKKSQTGKPASDNPSTTTATTNIEPNTKITAWNSIDVDKGRIEIGQDGSIMWKGPAPEIHYSTNTGLNVAPCNEWVADWLEAFNEQFK